MGARQIEAYIHRSVSIPARSNRKSRWRETCGKQALGCLTLPTLGY
jgi:hypothetical protein